MITLKNNYANILKNHKILCMPSCLVVEMMTKLYSQVSTINLSGNLPNVTPDLLILLRRLTFNLKTTTDAHRQSRIRFFIGDWADDKLRARKLFFNIMSRLGFISELLGAVEKGLLFRAIEEMTGEWSELDVIMEKTCGKEVGDGRLPQCGNYRSGNPSNWQHSMADAVLSLDFEKELEDPEMSLMLVCYNRIKQSLLQEAAAIEKKNGSNRRIDPDRVLCASDEDIAISCPKCTLMTESLRKGTTEVIHKRYAPLKARRISLRKSSEATSNALRQNRFVMPPSLAGISGRR